MVPVDHFFALGKPALPSALLQKIIDQSQISNPGTSVFTSTGGVAGSAGTAGPRTLTADS